MTWSRDDIAFLRLAAGEMPEADIAGLLDKPESDVVAMIEEEGLECYYKREMEWCVDCATWRTIRDGVCPVCKARQQMADLIAAYHAEAGDAPESTAYESPRVARSTDTPPARPSVAGMTASQAAETLEAWDKTVEAWELQRIITEKNRIKQATRRVRVAKGRDK